MIRRFFFPFALIVSIGISLVSADRAFAADSRLRGFVITPQITPDEIAVLKSWNVNVVRYTLVWPGTEGDSADAAAYDAWLSGELATFDSILPYLEASGIRVSLALHTPPGGFSKRGGSRPVERVFAEQWAQDKFITTWESIAARYKGRTGIWNYELLNEPAEANRPPAPLLEWNDLAQRTAEHIRAIDPDVQILMGPVYGKVTRLKSMKPLTLPNVMYTVHFYEPWRFTHQQLFGSKKVVQYPSSEGSKAINTKRLLPVFKFAKKNKVEIYVGEFSVVRFAPKGTGAKYLRDLISIFEHFKFNWTYHAFREADVWDLEFPDSKKSRERSAKPTGRLKTVLKALSKNQ